MSRQVRAMSQPAARAAARPLFGAAAAGDDAGGDIAEGLPPLSSVWDVEEAWQDPEEFAKVGCQHS